MASKLWGSRFSGSLSKLSEKFTYSIAYDSKLALYDCVAGVAHAKMLAACHIISPQDAAKTADTNEEKALILTARTSLDSAVSLCEGKMIPLLKSTNLITDEIRKLDDEIDTLNKTVFISLEKLSDLNKKHAKEAIRMKQVPCDPSHSKPPRK